MLRSNTLAQALTPPQGGSDLYGSDSRELLRPTRNRDFYRRHSQDTKLYRSTDVRSSAMQGMSQRCRQVYSLLNRSRTIKMNKNRNNSSFYKISKEKLYIRFLSHSYNNSTIYNIQYTYSYTDLIIMP